MTPAEQDRVLRSKADLLDKLLVQVPTPPQAITYEHGWELLTQLQQYKLLQVACEPALIKKESSQKRKTIKEQLAELDARCRANESFSYAVHPVYCRCGLYTTHDGRRLPFADRVIYCYTTTGTGTWPLSL